MARVIGIGGIFLGVEDVDASMRWYREVLGLDLEAWGGAKLDHPGRGHGLFSLFPASTPYFAPSSRPAMINLIVDDLDAVIRRVERAGVRPLGRDDVDASGRFAWVLDPDGFKIELWEPPAAGATA